MPESRDLALSRNVIAILWSLDRHEIESISDRDWARVLGNPWQAFMKVDDATRAAIWRAVQARLPEHLKEQHEEPA